ncbi:hypothetical protein K9U39_00300 [Rhodoblastus acidophilus]|nr:hypothetical protein [Rhodoblastus acidophilus]
MIILRLALEAFWMMSWLRVVFSVFALCGLLVANGAMAAKAHHCCPPMAAESTMHHHHGQSDDHSAIPKCCALGLCAAPAPLAATQAFAPAPRIALPVLFPLFRLAGLLSLPASPALRPPIA